MLIHNLIKFIYKNKKTLLSFFKFRFLACIAGVFIINILPLKAGYIGASRRDPAAAQFPSAMIKISPARRRLGVPTAPLAQRESIDPILRVPRRRRGVPTAPLEQRESIDPTVSVKVEGEADLPKANWVFSRPYFPRSTPLFTRRLYSMPLLKSRLFPTRFFSSRTYPRLLGTEILSSRLFSRRIFSTRFASPHISLCFTSGIYSCRVEETRFFQISCGLFINFSIET